MPTAKQRINISVSEEMRHALGRLAKRDNTPLASKAVHLLSLAIEIEEDHYFDARAKERDKKSVRWTLHKDAWR